MSAHVVFLLGKDLRNFKDDIPGMFPAALWVYACHGKLSYLVVSLFFVYFLGAVFFLFWYFYIVIQTHTYTHRKRERERELSVRTLSRTDVSSMKARILTFGFDWMFCKLK